MIDMHMGQHQGNDIRHRKIDAVHFVPWCTISVAGRVCSLKQTAVDQQAPQLIQEQLMT
jgi:hypothetical protein